MLCFVYTFVYRRGAYSKALLFSYRIDVQVYSFTLLSTSPRPLSLFSPPLPRTTQFHAAALLPTSSRPTPPRGVECWGLGLCGGKKGGAGGTTSLRSPTLTQSAQL